MNLKLVVLMVLGGVAVPIRAFRRRSLSQPPEQKTGRTVCLAGAGRVLHDVRVFAPTAWTSNNVTKQRSSPWRRESAAC